MPKGFESYSGFEQQPEREPEISEFHEAPEPKEAQRELFEAEERLRDVLEQISVLNENGGVIRHPFRYFELKQAAEIAMEEIKLARLHAANETRH
ncbi:hypothetical protein KC926_02615 [Candidatus Kaiserbacteria bacterium]|nr:hypothetical protein [Candidatus Kaiserbacteria bacterium]